VGCVADKHRSTLAASGFAVALYVLADGAITMRHTLWLLLMCWTSKCVALARRC